MINSFGKYIADPGPLPEGFTYGNGTGSNTPVNCEHCGVALLYFRPGDWWHDASPIYMCCDKSDLSQVTQSISDDTSLVVKMPMREGLLAQVQLFLDEADITDASLELIQKITS